MPAEDAAKTEQPPVQVSSINKNIIELKHSFGYDCKKLYNLCLIDENTLVFAAGNLITFFDIKTKNFTFVRSRNNGGIGVILKHPKQSLLTIGENGANPQVFIYAYPKMKLVSSLTEGTEQTFAHMAYNSDGELLATQGGDPDYTLIIWNWRENIKILRTKSFFNDVHCVTFSKYVEGHLATSGLSHIKFWKMTNTFTGLKLKGEIGRFGKTESCNILGIHPMPDEKIISGSEWGNILVWSESIIKYEICRKSRKSMHEKAITQIEMFDEEVMTAGLDGYIRVWFWPTVELADPPEDDLFVEIEPIYEYKIGSDGHDCEIIWMIKRKADPEDSKWYIQDGNGGIWLSDISHDNSQVTSKQLYSCHSGSIVGVAASPASNHFVTLGEDGRIHLYDYEKNSLLFAKKFPAKGCALLWIPISIDPSGLVLVAGFEDGVIRVLALNFNKSDRKTEPISIIQTVKSHKKGITNMSINPSGRIVVTSSQDGTIFVHQLARHSPFVKVVPIGLVSIYTVCTAIDWVPEHDARIILGCINNDILQIDLMEDPTSYTTVSYELPSIIIFNLEFRPVRVSKERDRFNPNDVEGEQGSSESNESEDEVDDERDRNEPSKILWLKCTNKGSIWVSMSGSFAGYLYEYKFETSTVEAIPMPGAEHIDINCFYQLKDFIIFGMHDGNIRINKILRKYRDMSDYIMLAMHDNYRGIIVKIDFSHDKKYLFSVGTDGNIFSYKWNGPAQHGISALSTEKVPISYNPVPDIDDPKFLSLEEEKVKNENDRRLRMAQMQKDSVLAILSDYKTEFEEIQNLLKTYSPSGKYEIVLDERITDDLNETLNKELKLVQLKLQYNVMKSEIGEEKLKNYLITPLETVQISVEDVRSNDRVNSFRIHKLTDAYHNYDQNLQQKLFELRERRKTKPDVSRGGHSKKESSVKDLEPFLKRIISCTKMFELDTKLSRVLNKYHQRKLKEDDRKQEWQQVRALKPNSNINHPNDVAAIIEAEKTIGDYSLKIDPMSPVCEDFGDTTILTLKALLDVKREMHDIRNDFNQEMYALNETRNKLIDIFNEKLRTMEMKNNELSHCPTMAPNKYAQAQLNGDSQSKNMNFFTRIYSTELNKITSTKITPIRLPVVHYDKKNNQFEITDRIRKLERYIIGFDKHQIGNYAESAISFKKKTVNRNHFFYPADYKLSSLIPWEDEQRQTSYISIIFNQDQICYEIVNKINEFSDLLLELKDRCLKTDVEIKFLELYLHTLHQELWIFKDFGKLEVVKVDAVNKYLQQLKVIQSEIAIRNSDIEDCRDNIEYFNDQDKAIVEQFMMSCSSNKYVKVLFKILKKKEKIVDELNGNEESSESESSSDDQATEQGSSAGGSVFVKIDQNTRPVDLDRRLYDLTYELQSQRQALVRQIKQEHLTIEENTLEIEKMSGEISRLETEANTCKSDLDAFRRNMQNIINDVETTVVINMNHLQYFQDESTLFSNVKDALLFNTENMMKLYARVNQLEAETMEVKRRHRIDVMHLARMKTDCIFMEKRNDTLREEIHEVTIKKFGMIVTLDSLEQAILSKMVYEMRANVKGLRTEYAKKLNYEQKLTTELEMQYNRVIQEATEKMNILTVLQEENNYLYFISDQNNKMMSKPARVKYDLHHDVMKLRDISEQQREQIQILQREIKTLSMKSKPFDPFFCKEQNIPRSNENALKFSEKEYQESAISEILNKLPKMSTNNTAHYSKVLITINNLVEEYVDECLLKHLNESDVNSQKRSCLYLSQHCINVALKHAGQISDEVLNDQIVSAIYEQFPKLKKGKVGLLKTRELFRRILKEIQFSEETEDIGEVLRTIVGQAADVKPNSTQMFVTDVLKQMILTLSLTDLKDVRTLDIVSSEMIRLKCYNLATLDKPELIESLSKFSTEIYNDDVHPNLITGLVESLVSIDSNRKKEKEVKIDLQTK